MNINAHLDTPLSLRVPVQALPVTNITRGPQALRALPVRGIPNQSTIDLPQPGSRVTAVDILGEEEADHATGFSSLNHGPVLVGDFESGVVHEYGAAITGDCGVGSVSKERV